jgi:prevent-host-death family protein
MADTHVPIGQVKRDISELVNRVAYGGERIVLTSRGKPKAALVSMEDYQQIGEKQQADRMAQWQAWLSEADALADKILERRGGVPVDVDEILEQDRRDLEARDDWIAGGH